LILDRWGGPKEKQSLEIAFRDTKTKFESGPSQPVITDYG